MASPKSLERTQLPDDIVLEILLRLPAERVLKFRSVCQKLRALTSSSYFVERHMRQGVPGILGLDIRRCKHKLFLIQGWEEARNKKLRITDCLPKCIEADSWINYYPCFSYDGLIVLEGAFLESKKRGFRSSVKEFIIYNPINQETMRILIPLRLEGKICGLFMHPSLKEYCALMGLYEGENIEFKMVNLGPEETQWKDIQAGSSVSYLPKLPQVQVDDVLYWILSSYTINPSPSCDEIIMAFDIKREEFSLMPHPGSKSGCNHSNMDLLKSDQHLSFSQISYPENNHSINSTIDIWMLTDVSERVWIKRYTINMVLEYLSPGLNRAIGIVNGELLLQSGCLTFYACNLEHQSMRKFGREYVGCWKTVTHWESLVSLKNCKPEIRMEE